MSVMLDGFLQIFNIYPLLFIFIGVVIGIIFGAMPGLSATMAVTLFLPITFGMNHIHGLSLLLGLFIGGISGGLITAILINIPGTPSSIATAFDGYPMTLKGEAGKALGVGVVYSFIGGLISFLGLIFLAPQISNLALKFSPIEYFSITAFSLTLIASMAGSSVIKGLLSGFVGLSIALIGPSPIDGTTRFTFGFHQFDGGLNLIAVLIGIFAIPEIIKASRKSVSAHESLDANVDKIRGFGFSLKEFITQIPNMIRSALIGLGIGILPGIGGGTSNTVSYLAAKNSSKHPEKYGTGIIDGVIASETANNASIGGALIPLLTLGIPGDPVTAVLLGGLMIHGITPGPMFLVNNRSLFYSIFMMLIIGNIFMLVTEFFGIKFFVKMLNVPKQFLYPIIVVLCAVGAFGSTNRIFNVFAMLICGVVGYLLDKYKFPLTPIILSYILGPLVEANLRRGLMFSDGSFFAFFKSPIAAIFMSLGIISLLGAAYREIRNLIRRRKKIVK
jgi:putative tricarboxylic transport membrane protein